MLFKKSFKICEFNILLSNFKLYYKFCKKKNLYFLQEFLRELT